MMQFQFTPAAERALAAAANWTSRADDNGALGVPEVLLGLVAEADCRAALLLAAHGVDDAAVRRRFANLARIVEPDASRASQFSAEWLACLEVAERLLIEYPRPLVLATEHLLLGIAASDNEVSRWLGEQGLDVEALEAEVHRLAGHQPGPLPFDAEEEATREMVFSELATAALAQSEPELVEHERMSALRVVDAAANRASEGLRVVEDYLRFALDDAHLTAQAKSIRHELASILKSFSALERHRARDAVADVGADLTLEDQTRHDDLAAVAAASFKRVEQSLRSLEEFSKTIAPETAGRFEKLRYRVYTLERAVDITRASLQRLAEAQLYVLVDGGASVESVRTLVESLVAAGVSAIQLRDKRLADRELLARAHALRAATRGTKTLFIVNDRPDLAVLSGADGVHVGQEELSPKEARRVLGPAGLIGVSTHSLEQARRAVLEGADYIGVGPTFPSATKHFSQFTGTELLAVVAAEIHLPAFAIGGISLDNVAAVREAGFLRVAVGAAITAAPDPALAARRFLQALRS